MIFKKTIRKFVLDTGVFRKLVGAKTRSDVEGILKIINNSIPAQLVASFGLWPEYIGLKRPGLRNPDNYEPFNSLQSLENFNDVVSATLSALIDSYKGDTLLSAEALKLKVQEFFSLRVSKTINEARFIAEDIIFFKGQDFNGAPFSFEAISKQIAIDYALDETFYLVRFFPISFVNSVGVFTRQLAETLKTYVHMPVFRLADSVLDYIFRIHRESPDETSATALKVLRKANEGIRKLKPESEVGDCMYLWTAIQGIFSTSGLSPATVITFDTQSRKRVTLMIETLASEFGGASLLRALKRSGNLKPGFILVVAESNFEVRDSIAIAPLVRKFLFQSFKNKILRPFRSFSNFRKFLGLR